MLCSTAPASEILAHFGEEGLRCEDLRVAMGALRLAPSGRERPKRRSKGRLISDKTVAEAAQIAASESAPSDDMRGEAWYRREMVEVLVRRAVMKSLDRVFRPDEMVYPDRLW